jgi:hypothetical protein
MCDEHVPVFDVRMDGKTFPAAAAANLVNSNK